MPVPLYQAKAEFFRTLGHPVRIRILELLSQREHAVHELLAEIGVEASSLSQQLSVLRRSALVTSQRTARATSAPPSVSAADCVASRLTSPSTTRAPSSTNR